jgi:hypothetical protein
MRLAARTPVRCSSCFGQKPGSAHIDFESSYDGPPISEAPRAPHLDWVVICDECIEAAHALLPAQHEVVDKLRAQLHAAESERDEVSAYADRLEAAITDKPERKQHTSSAEPKPARKPRYQPKG